MRTLWRVAHRPSNRPTCTCWEGKLERKDIGGSGGGWRVPNPNVAMYSFGRLIVQVQTRDGPCLLLIDRARRPLGRSSLSAFPIAYGLWRFAGTDVPTARAKIDAALEAGIDLFDHADVYGCDGGGQLETPRSCLGRPGRATCAMA